ncbi:MAG: NfeD family protein [Planctomycetota bacterium]|jgi:membrane-bound serine protease (ClpP class)
MRRSVRRYATVTVWLLLATAVLTGEPNEPGEGPLTTKTAVIPCKDMIDHGLYKSIQRRTQKALGEGCDYLIYEIDTFGGDLLAAYNIWEYFMHTINLEVHTVAYVSKKAISAGALISVACEDIIMKENTRIGDCAPIVLGGKLEGTEREKIETDIRTAFSTAAEANHYPEALLKAMVTQQIEVYKVRNIKTDEYEFFVGGYLPEDANEYDLKDKKLVVGSDMLLTLKASEALEYGIARTLVKDREGVLAFLAERDGVTFEQPVAVLKPNWSEQMVRWLNSPAVMGILVMLALLGVYVEFHTPGVGLPGLAAVICFTIIIGSKYLTGLANWLEVALFIVGIVLLLVEIFVIPGFGLVGFLGIVLILGGLFGMLARNAPDRLPWPETEMEWQVFADGVIGLVLGFSGFLVLAALLARYLPKVQVCAGLVLLPTGAKQGDEFEVSMTAPPESKICGISVGDVGEVVSTLRPAGRVRFDSSFVDCVAEGDFLAKGAKVVIIEISGNRVVVKRAENPSEG